MSIFDLYLHYPRKQEVPHGPHEFLKPQNKVSATSQDSFRFQDSPEISERKSIPVGKPSLVVDKAQPTLNDYKQLIRQVSNGMISVIRRKDFPSVKLPQVVPQALPHPKRSVLEPIALKPKNPIRSYAENRKYWDNVNTMMAAKKEAKPERPMLHRSATLSGVKGLSRSSTLVSQAKGESTVTKVLKRSYTKAPGSLGQSPFLSVSHAVNATFTQHAEMQELEVLKADIREKAAALVRTVKSYPKAKKYMSDIKRE